MAKKIIRIILSLLGLALGIYALINILKQEPPDFIKLAISAAVVLFSLGWLFDLRFAKIITGILFIPAGIAGALMRANGAWLWREIQTLPAPVCTTWELACLESVSMRTSTR